MSRTIASVLAAAMLVLAGCGASVAPGSPTAALEGTSAGASTDASTGTGTVTFYISDQPNAINDFEHLNVTITKVGFKKVDADDAEDPVENESDAESENGTETDPEDDEETEEADGEDDAGSEDDRDDERGEENRTEDEDEDEDGEWVTYDVENRTVDLTELQGENASRLSAFELPNGTYTKVFVHVSEVEGTLKDGTQVNVKLPSQKLQLNKRFTVGNGEAVDFVFDITVFKAGNSGKYILKPVVSESGVDQPIREVDEDDEDEDEAEADEREDASDLQARFVGSVAPGENATIEVIRQGEPVANATVRVDGERVGTTDADGRITVPVPSDAEELEIEITAGEAEVSLEREFETDGERTESDDENAGDNDDG